MNKTNKFVWLDSETLGLNDVGNDGQIGAVKHPIIEIAGVITDMDLNQVGEPIHLILSSTQEQIDAGDEWAVNTHKESGLLDKSLASKLTPDGAQKKLIAWLKSAGIQKFARDSDGPFGYMAGNSIKLDRDFIMYQMPELHRYMHYRMLDLAGPALMARQWKPELVYQKKYEHLALSDIHESIEEAKVFKEFFLQSMPVSREIFRSGFLAGMEEKDAQKMDSKWVEYNNDAKQD